MGKVMNEQETRPADLESNDGEWAAILALQPRNISAERLHVFEGYVAEMLTAFGLDLNTPAARDTPRRFVQALYDVTAGYDGDPKLLKLFETECRGGSDCRVSQVIEGPIDFFSLCEHHALPFFGRAYVGYVARADIIGLSKLTRVVRLFARRFGVQERLGQQIADVLDAILQPHGVAVYLEARHLCVAMRGVREVTPLTRTTAWRGEYEENPALRTEFFALCMQNRGPQRGQMDILEDR
jgi:GTP cyclohydrolase I